MSSINNDNPDKEIEHFWLNFKISMNNFYNCISISRPIQEWCDCLNDLQKKRKYLDIEKNIRNYISLYAIDLIRFTDTYHINILCSNIKRWNKISNKYNFSDNNKEYHNFIFVMLDICHLLLRNNEDISNIFSQFELFLLYKDYKILIKYSVENNKSGILDKLICFDSEIISQIKKMYNITNIPNNISSRKLIKLINNN